MSDDRVEEVKKNILSPSQWVRILYMVFYAVACWVLLFVLPVIIVCQVIIALITGRDNENLRDFGGKLSAYFHNALDYLLYVNEAKPWPFDSEDEDDDDDNADFGHFSNSDQASSSNEQAAGDDVFADISFTDDAPEGKAKEPGTDNNIDNKIDNNIDKDQGIDFAIDEQQVNEAEDSANEDDDVNPDNNESDNDRKDPV